MAHHPHLKTVPSPYGSPAGNPGVSEAARHEQFAAYERRFALAMASIPSRRPWIASERAEILETAKRCLGIREDWIPEITAQTVRLSTHAGFSVEYLQSASWPGCRGAAYLYLPEAPAAGPLPVVILACGHGGGGKQTEGYRFMAEHLARHGMAVLISDNIGQGERVPMGHANPVQVFECGLSIQGLIVMETIGWLNWLRAQERFDRRRIAAIGNSGGGTLTLFLGALRRDQFAAVSSSGYPGTFEFVARKEKKHCHCNLLPRIVGELEMWQLYGCVAPVPLFLFQGGGDPLFPGDLFWQTARKVSTAYRENGAPDRFQARVTEGGHSWDAPRRRMLTEYLCEALGVPFDESRIAEPPGEPALAPCFESWPKEAATADSIARHLSGKTASASRLWEVFPPSEPGTFSAPEPDPFLENSIFRGDPRQILAQFEAFLKSPRPASSDHA